ncbi:hypothetical protein J1N10_05200 [Carboxylicivirga sp. A043]|uniref:right-handed parallel beta-helix repeat-containing protein n=1 Tax=Carboxylicivirga litoralis TaxID=2816963 RepID=UPI0021CB125B|nr:hypothetical protein [Carboxylicivirga sp. A043]MCU4155361.1 hypothetical protein [Carboxylicivirga sp. A043]
MELHKSADLLRFCIRELIIKQLYSNSFLMICQKGFIKVVALLFFCIQVHSQNMFPGAEGFGSQSRGAYGGDTLPEIIRVTTLKDGGPGSLRSAVYKKYPRIIVFEVGGVIELRHTLRINDPYVFIAAQTAPYPGITLKNYSLGISTHDVLVQGLKVRPGNFSGRQIDGINIADDSTKLHNIIIDHCSISWALDENIGILNGGNGVTVSHCIISECLNQMNHSCGMLATSTGQVSIIKNLFVHNEDRNPLVSGDTKEALVANNLIYNSDTHVIYFGSMSEWKRKMRAAAIGNYYFPGERNRNEYIISINPGINPQSQLYLNGNKTENVNDDDPWSDKYIHNPANMSLKAADIPFKLPHVHLLSTANLKKYLIENCGAQPGNRDCIDERIINDVINYTGSKILLPHEVGGWVKETSEHTLELPDNPHSDDNNDGFTNLENWLNKYLYTGVK